MRDHVDLTPPERDELVDALRLEIAAAWETSEVRPVRPSPEDEARSGMAVFEQALWDAVPRFLRTLNTALVKHTGRGLPPDRSPVRFGSWIGGDRDGNPAVTSEVTAAVVLLARWQCQSLPSRDRSAAAGAVDERRQPRADARASGAPEPDREACATCAIGWRRRCATSRSAWTGGHRSIRARWCRLSSSPRRSRSAAAHSSRRAMACSRADGCSTCSGASPRSARRSCGSTCVRTRHGTQRRCRSSRGRWAPATTPHGTSRASAFPARVARVAARRSAVGARVAGRRRSLRDVSCRRRAAPESLGASIISMTERPSDVLAVELLQTLAGARRRSASFRCSRP